MPVMNVNGEALHYDVVGKGPDVLFIHSLGTNAYIWRNQIAALKDRYRCITFDCRGHGRSSYNGIFTVPNVAADLKAGLETLGVERCNVIGLSMGGPIALVLSEVARDLVASLVISGSFYDTRAGAADRLSETRAETGKVTMLEFGQAYAKLRLMPRLPQQEFDDMAEAVAMVTPAAYVDTLAAISQTNFFPYVEKVQVPTLFLYGEHERERIVTQSSEMQRAIPGARIEPVPDAGHLACLDAPDAFTALISEFLESQSRS